MACATRMGKFNASDLYVVITEEFCAGRDPVDVLDAVLDAGVRLVQLREKHIDDRALYERAEAFRERTAQYNAALIIDDRLDIAIATAADGVHLGQGDLPLEVARSLTDELIIGASTHNLAEAIAAQAAGADYINIGPIFGTQTKETPMGPLGPETLERILPHVSCPWSCMGGIKAHNIHKVVQRGARHPAVVTAVTAADDIRAAAEELRQAILAHSPA